MSHVDHQLLAVFVLNFVHREMIGVSDYALLNAVVYVIRRVRLLICMSTAFNVPTVKSCMKAGANAPQPAISPPSCKPTPLSVQSWTLAWRPL